MLSFLLVATNEIDSARGQPIKKSIREGLYGPADNKQRGLCTVVVIELAVSGDSNMSHNTLATLS